MRSSRFNRFAIATALACACAFGAVFAAIPQNQVSGSNAAALPSAVATDEIEAATGAAIDEAAAEGIDDHAAAPGDDPAVYETGAALATLAEGVSDSQANEALANAPGLAGAYIESRVDGNTVKLSLPSGLAVEHAVDLLDSVDEFESAQPNYRYYPCEASDAALATAAISQTATAATANLVAGTALGNALSLQSAAPNDPYYAQNKQWALASVNAPDAWDYVAANIGATSSVTVAVIDNGFRVNHEDLKEHVVDAYNVASDTSTLGTDNSTHGTHVAGIVSAVTNNNKGVASIGGNALGLMLLRASDSDGDITTDTIVKAYSYIMKKASTHNVRVVNMSLGAPSRYTINRNTDAELYDAIATARNSGIVTVVAACNEESNFNAPFNAFPADFDNVVSVINLAQAKNDDGVKRDSSSNYNTLYQAESDKAKNISAPGTDIYSTYNGNSSYGSESGTSMSTPLVAGVFGLMFTVNPNLSAEAAESLMYGSAKDLTASPASAGWDRYTGYGEVDAAAAVRSAGAGMVMPASDTATSAAINNIAACKVTVNDAAYTGRPTQPKVKVADGSKTLTRNVDYTIQFRSNTKVGTAAYTVKGKGAYGGIAVGTFKVIPKSTSIKKLKAISKGLTVTWKKRSAQTTGYQIRVATNKAFTKNVKTVKVAKKTTASKKVKSLKAKKKYYVKVRTYKTVSGTKYYSTWSKAKTIKTKR